MNTLEIEAELYFKNERGLLELYALGKDNCIYRPKNLQALRNPFSPGAQFTPYTAIPEMVQKMLYHSLIFYADGTSWHSHEDLDGKKHR